MEKEIHWEYKDISGNIFTRHDVTMQEQIFELVNTYYGITRKEFQPEKIKIIEENTNGK